MASSTFSSVLANLYPRESGELQALLERHHIGYGRPDDVFAFPPTLAASEALQDDLRNFILTSRERLGGPVSRSAMLHLLLSGIGGPRAVDLGPEADTATGLITSFLEELGGWPEDAFPDFDEPASFQDKPATPPARRLRSLAASLATQNSFPGQEIVEDEETLSTEDGVRQEHPEPRMRVAVAASRKGSARTSTDPSSTPRHAAEAAALQAIALSLAKLEESYRATADRLDFIQDRLHQLEGAGTGTRPEAETTAAEPPKEPAGASDPASPAVSPKQPDLSAEAASKAGSPVAIVRSWPAPKIDDSTTSSVSPHGSAPVRELAPVPVTSQAPLPLASDAPSDLPTAAEPPAQSAPGQVDPAVFVRLDRSTAAEHQTEMKPAGEWKTLFSAPDEPKRSIAVVPVVVACVLLALIIIAVVLFVRSQAPATTSDLETGPAASIPQPETATTPPGSSTPRSPSSNDTRAAAHDSARSSATGASTTGSPNRVLGARETFQPKVSGESFPANKQLTFVAASTMDQRLVYSPRPQHPRVAGLTGLSGMVVMEVMVSSDGSVEDVHVLGGHHLLRDAAVNAVRTWRYRPVLQNGHAIPVRTIVRIDFSKTEDTRANN